MSCLLTRIFYTDQSIKVIRIDSTIIGLVTILNWDTIQYGSYYNNLVLVAVSEMLQHILLAKLDLLD
jgi:hypothetical protein